ncbi:hypothetical protein MATL_G00156050 [Megalops atlanticus]|uniref:Uncharacterized protein n=1 Tax=Megalops atlanticus TaxID=7932 RepID=A0A9D3PPS5_MEGAT|nr:hypothetical protein MATL_G00156050 [Megalops atlanticus]
MSLFLLRRGKIGDLFPPSLTAELKSSLGVHYLTVRMKQTCQLPLPLESSGPFSSPSYCWLGLWFYF